MSFASIVERLREQYRQALSSRGTHEHTIFMVVASVLGVVAGLMTVLLEKAIAFFRYIFFTMSADLYSDHPDVYYWAVIPFLPALGGLIVGLLAWWFKMSGESASASEVLKWAAVDASLAKPKVVWYRTLVTSIFLGSGGSGGREGPITQICGALGAYFGTTLKGSSERIRMLVGCGAAAGIAASFNAPIAGVIFTVELVFGDFNVISFLPILVSSIMATTVKRIIVGDIPVLQAPTYSLVSPWEIALYAVLGGLCGRRQIVFSGVIPRGRLF